MHLPDDIHAEFAGDARAFTGSAGSQALLIVAALIAVYIVLGVLYESLAHPLTIISTLPSAGLGALLALMAFNPRVDHRLHRHHFADRYREEERHHAGRFCARGRAPARPDPERAIYEACLARFRPILMTTLAALLGAVPLVIAVGPGTELRRPLGITIIGGLVVSQILTLYTTPMIYLLLDRLHRRLWGRSRERTPPDIARPAARPGRINRGARAGRPVRRFRLQQRPSPCTGSLGGSMKPVLPRVIAACLAVSAVLCVPRAGLAQARKGRLPRPDDPPDRRIRGWRRQRHHRAHHRTETAGKPGPDRRGGKSGRRRRTPGSDMSPVSRRTAIRCSSVRAVQWRSAPP